MSNKEHQYTLSTRWTGNMGEGTRTYSSYSRDHSISAPGKPAIEASSDPAFRGDAGRYNPEELLLASLSSCHMLWYLHLCAEAGINVSAYTDNALGIMQESPGGAGQFTEVRLRPAVVITDASLIERANALHKKAHELCFIARSVNFPVHHEPHCTAG